MVAGDLNDEPHAATTQVLHGPPGPEVGIEGFVQPDAGDAQGLWNTAPFIAQEERWSRVYRGRLELIDYVLLACVHRCRPGRHHRWVAEDSIETGRDPLPPVHHPVGCHCFSDERSDPGTGRVEPRTKARWGWRNTGREVRRLDSFDQVLAGLDADGEVSVVHAGQ